MSASVTNVAMIRMYDVIRTSLRDVLPEERDEQPGPDEHERRRDSHGESVGEHVRHRHRRAHPEQLDEDRILAAMPRQMSAKTRGGRRRARDELRRARGGAGTGAATGAAVTADLRDRTPRAAAATSRPRR